MRISDWSSDVCSSDLPCQIEHLRAASAGRCRAGIALLQGVGHIEDHRQACHLLHDAEAEHVDDQIVVAEAGAAIAEDDLFVAGFAELLDDVADLARAEELRLDRKSTRLNSSH